MPKRVPNQRYPSRVWRILLTLFWGSPCSVFQVLNRYWVSGPSAALADRPGPYTIQAARSDARVLTRDRSRFGIIQSCAASSATWFCSGAGPAAAIRARDRRGNSIPLCGGDQQNCGGTGGASALLPVPEEGQKDHTSELQSHSFISY